MAFDYAFAKQIIILLNILEEKSSIIRLFHGYFVPLRPKSISLSYEMLMIHPLDCLGVRAL